MSFLLPKAAGAKKVFCFLFVVSLVSSSHSFLHQFLNFHSNTPSRSATFFNVILTTGFLVGRWEQGGRVVTGRKILENKYICNVFPEKTLKVDEGDGSGVFLGELTFLWKK